MKYWREYLWRRNGAGWVRSLSRRNRCGLAPVRKHMCDFNPGSVQLTVNCRVSIKRVYEPPGENDGVRVLVDRLWPRGISREKAGIDLWLKDIAPSNGLRAWFGHDPSRWEDFRDRYLKELKEKKGMIEELARLRGISAVTLLYAAKDREKNNAVVLGDLLKLSRRVMRRDGEKSQ